MEHMLVNIHQGAEGVSAHSGFPCSTSPGDVLTPVFPPYRRGVEAQCAAQPQDHTRGASNSSNAHVQFRASAHARSPAQEPWEHSMSTPSPVYVIEGSRGGHERTDLPISKRHAERFDTYVDSLGSSSTARVDTSATTRVDHLRKERCTCGRSTRTPHTTHLLGDTTARPQRAPCAYSAHCPWPWLPVPSPS